MSGWHQKSPCFSTRAKPELQILHAGVGTSVDYNRSKFTFSQVDVLVEKTIGRAAKSSHSRARLTVIKDANIFQHRNIGPTGSAQPDSGHTCFRGRRRVFTREQGQLWPTIPRSEEIG